MEKQKLLQASYLDILFDNRNKKYGGYELRSRYPDRAKRAASMVLLVAGMLSSIPVIAGILAGNKKPVASVPLTKVVPIVDVLIPKEKPTVKPVVKAVEAPSIAVTVAVRPLVIRPTDDVHTDAPPTIDSLGDRLAGLNNNAGKIGGVAADNGQQNGDGNHFQDGRIDDPPTPKPIADMVTEMPKFNGDVNDYLNRHLNYPEQARNASEEGRAVVKFVVNEDGAVTDAEIAKSTSSRALDQEALRVVSAMPHWKAGKQQGVAVKVYFSLPITFRLD